jgi:micrococcal nuclease
MAVIYVKVGGSWTTLNAELLRNGLAEMMFIPPSEFNPYGWMS